MTGSLVLGGWFEGRKMRIKVFLVGLRGMSLERASWGLFGSLRGFSTGGTEGKR
jgi:hypothetical protein